VVKDAFPFSHLSLICALLGHSRAFIDPAWNAVPIEHKCQGQRTHFGAYGTAYFPTKVTKIRLGVILDGERHVKLTQV